MTDTWTHTPQTNEPPASNTDVDTDPNWKSYMNEMRSLLSDGERRSVSSSHALEEVVIAISGEEPSDWRLEHTDTRDNPFSEISTFSRLYPKITYQRFVRVCLDFHINGTDNNFLHTEFYVAVGTPQTFQKQRVYVTRHTGWTLGWERHREYTPRWDESYPPEDAVGPEMAPEVSQLLWSSKILDETIPEGEKEHDEKDVYPGV